MNFRYQNRTSASAESLFLRAVALAFLFWSAPVCLAQNQTCNPTWNFADFTFTPQAVSGVRITPVFRWTVSGNIVIIGSGGNLTYPTGAGGSLTLSNVITGYGLRVELLSKTSGLSATPLVCFTNYFPTNTTGNIIASSPQYIGVPTNSIPYLVAGSGIVISATGNQVAISATGAGVNAITNGQSGVLLGNLTVSNSSFGTVTVTHTNGQSLSYFGVDQYTSGAGLTNALNAAVNGDMVSLSPGVFAVSTQLHFPANVTVRGAGQISSAIYTTFDNEDSASISPTNGDLFLDLKMDGTGLTMGSVFGSNPNNDFPFSPVIMRNVDVVYGGQERAIIIDPNNGTGVCYLKMYDCNINSTYPGAFALIEGGDSYGHTVVCYNTQFKASAAAVSEAGCTNFFYSGSATSTNSIDIEDAGGTFEVGPGFSYHTSAGSIVGIAGNGSGLTGLAAGQLTGTLPAQVFPSFVLTNAYLRATNTHPISNITNSEIIDLNSGGFLNFYLAGSGPGFTLVGGNGMSIGTANAGISINTSTFITGNLAVSNINAAGIVSGIGSGLTGVNASQLNGASNLVSTVLYTNSAVTYTFSTNAAGQVTEFLATNILTTGITGNAYAPLPTPAQTNALNFALTNGNAAVANLPGGIISGAITVTGGALLSGNGGGLTNTAPFPLATSPANLGILDAVVGGGGNILQGSASISNSVDLYVPGKVVAGGVISGNGGALTNLSAANLSGTINGSSVTNLNTTNLSGTITATAAGALTIQANAGINITNNGTALAAATINYNKIASANRPYFLKMVDNGDTNAGFFFGDGTASTSAAVPSMVGFNDQSGRSSVQFFGLIPPSADSGSVPIMTFIAAEATSTNDPLNNLGANDPVTRPLVGFGNLITNNPGSGQAMLQINASGLVQANYGLTVSGPFSAKINTAGTFLVNNTVIASNTPPAGVTNGLCAIWDNGTNPVVRTSVSGSASSSADYTISHVETGTTNATALTSFTATFTAAFTDTNYTATSTGNGFALASAYVSNKTTNSCVFNMTIATGNIDWAVFHK